MNQYPRTMGPVITPSDSDYEKARRIWNERFDCRPCAIVYPRDVDEVVAALCFARDNAIPLRIRSGGHNVEGFCIVDDGLVIDLSTLSSVEVNADRIRATIGPGTLLGDVYAGLWEAGVTIPAGVCPDIRIGGHVLGGGVGMLVRSRGMLIDSLVGLTVVDAAGEVLDVDDDHHPDLMWACRGGGGGNFGIVTSYTFDTRPIADVTLVSAKWEWRGGMAVLDTWQHWMRTADDRANSRFTIFPGSADTVMMTTLFEGSPQEWESVAHPLLGTHTPREYSVQQLPYIDTVGKFSESVPSTRAKFVPALAAGPLDHTALTTLERWHKDAPAGAKTGLYGLGGAVRSAELSARSAFAHRGAHLCVEYLGHWSEPGDDTEHLAWLSGIRDDMRSFMTGGAYVNSPDRDIQDWLHAYYGDSLPRLMDVKRRYDLNEVFNFEQSIPACICPADASAAGLTDSVLARLAGKGLIMT
jgi:FAD/FMN-containing dehydrogenase